MAEIKSRVGGISLAGYLERAEGMLNLSTANWFPVLGAKDSWAKLCFEWLQAKSC